MRTTFLLSVTIMLFTVVSVALAGGSANVEVYKFKFDGTNGAVELELNSETMGFGLKDLRPGESRTTVTEDGSSITISRLGEVYSLDLGGEVFEIPARHDSGQMTQHHENSRMVMTRTGFVDDSLTIVSKEPLDEARQATIRNALAAAGIVDNIEFLSPDLAMSESVRIEEYFEESGDGERQMVIKRVIAD